MTTKTMRTTKRSKGPCLLILLLCMFISSSQHVVGTAQGQDSSGTSTSTSTSTSSATSRRVQTTPVKTPTKSPAAAVPVSPSKPTLAAPTTISTASEAPTFLKATTAPPTVSNNATDISITPTPAPTVNQTEQPTLSPTVRKTRRPTTPEPTDNPTTMAPTYPEGSWIPIQADITMKLSPVNGYLEGDTESFFLYAVQEVLLSSFVTTHPTMTNLQVSLVSQEQIEGFARFKPAYVHHVRGRRNLAVESRDLQQDEEDPNSALPEWEGGEKGALKVELNITATERVTFLSVEEQELEQPPLSQEEFEFQLNDAVRSMQVQLLETLQQGGGEINTAFFAALLAVQIQTDAPTQAPVSPTESPTRVAKTQSPTAAPVLQFQWPTDPPNEAAVNTGGALLLALAFFCCRRMSTKQIKNGVVDTSGSNSPSSEAGLKQHAPPSTQRKPYKPANQQPIIMKQSSYDSSGRQRDDSDADGDSASMAMYSYVRGGGDQGSFMGDTLGGGTDAMSYAYSLEAGIEPSIADSDSFGMQVPMEIPQLGMVGKNHHYNTIGFGGGGGGTSHLHSASMMHGGGHGAGTSSSSAYHRSNDREIELENSLIEITTSDLQLTKSELAMLPSDLMGSQNGDSLQDDQSDFDESTLGGTLGGVGGTTTNTITLSTAHGGPMSSSSPAPRFVTRTCVAPSGKLGIIIDTTVEGPVVHKVNYGSALTGVVFPGDIIVAIDNVDTRAMSASAITNLMVKTAHQARTLTIISDAK
jgi:hypothetical protein